MENTLGNLLKSRKFEIAAVIFFIVMLFMRIVNIMSITPEYDEIWTLRNYVDIPVSRILTDVATPNNHVLNSLSIKALFGLIGRDVVISRIPSLLSYIGIFILLLTGAIRYLHTPYMRLCSIMVILADGLLLHYAEVARGYEMQTFFVLGIFFALLSMGQSQRKRVSAICWLFCSVAACLTISSGILYVTFLTFLWWLMVIPFRSGVAEIWKKEREWIFAGIVFTVFVLIWYAGNFQAFASGRANFGEVFHSVSQYGRYFSNILLESLLFIPLLVALVGILKLNGFPRKVCILAFGSTLLMLLSAIITKGGPVRIYLPLIPVVWFSAAFVLDHFFETMVKLQHAAVLVTLMIVAAAMLISDSSKEHFADIDLGVVYSSLKEVSPDVIVVYRPTDAYVISNVFGKEARMDFAKRLVKPSSLLLTGNNSIGAIRFKDFDTVFFDTGASPDTTVKVMKRFLTWRYPLRKIRAGEDLKGHAVLCILRGYVPELRMENNWLKNHFSCVNSFLNPVQGMMPWYLFAADGASVKADDLLAIENARPDIVEFYIPGK